MIPNDWELDIFKRHFHIGSFRVRAGLSLDLHQPIKKCASIHRRLWAKSFGKWRTAEEIVLDSRGMVGKGWGGGRRSCTRHHTKAGTEKDFFFTWCFLSFIVRIFEQKLTVLRNPLLAPLHFYLLFYSLFSHLRPSYLHNEKRFGGEEGHVSIVMGLPC